VNKDNLNLRFVLFWVSMTAFIWTLNLRFVLFWVSMTAFIWTWNMCG